VTLTFNWAMAVVGENHFEYNFRDVRKVLKPGSPLHLRGQAAGLPWVILAWLAGNPATDQLTFTVDKLSGSQGSK